MRGVLIVFELALAFMVVLGLIVLWRSLWRGE
jgi:hypothetical protein